MRLRSQPIFQLLPAIDRAGWVVRRAQVDDVRFYGFVRKGQKTVFSRRVHVDNLPARHGVRIYIYGVDRVGHQYGIVRVKQIQDVADVALRAVTHENLTLLKLNVVQHIVSFELCTQEVVALLRAVAAEGSSVRHFIDRAVQRGNNRRAQGLSYIAYSQADKLFIGMGFPKFVYLFAIVEKR